MNPTDQVMLTVARRTKKNLDFIYAHKDSGDVYEFTQLVNSMLALVVSMRTEYFSERPLVTWDEVISKIEPMKVADILRHDLTWDDLRVEAAKYSRKDGRSSSDAFSDLIGNLRNAFAHCCWEFYSDDDGEIKGLKLWNVPHESMRHKRDKWYWQETLSEAQIRAIAFVFIEYLEATRGREVAFV